MNERAHSRDQVASLARGLSVLRLFGERRTTMTITELAQASDLTAASARRILLTLRDLGYVRQDGRRFGVTPKVLDLGYAYLSSMPVWQIAQPVLVRLSDEFNLAASSAVLDGLDIVYVVKAPHRRVSASYVGTGTRQPAHVTAMGRVLLAGLADDELDRAITAITYREYTPTSVTDPEQLRAILMEVRRRNYATIDQEYDFGLRALAVPIRDKLGNVVAAMNVAGHTRSCELDDLVARVLPALFEGADEIRMQIAV